MSRFFRYPLIIAVLVFMLTQAFGWLYVQDEKQQLLNEQKHNVFIRLSTLKANLEGLVNSHLVVLRGLKAEVAINPTIAKARFSEIARELISDDLHIRNIALAPDLIVSHVYPLAGNGKVLGLNYRKLPGQLAAIEKSIAVNAIIVAGPVNLVQGGRGLIARLPVYVGQERGEFWGIIGAVIRYEELMEEAGVNEKFWRNGLWIRGKDATGRDGLFFNETPSQQAIANSVTFDIRLPYGSWQIGYYPEGGWQVDTRQLLPLYIFTIFLASVSAIGSYIILVAYRDKGEAVKTANLRANYDGLTGLMNRHRFTQELISTIERADQDGTQFSLLFLDIDDFKPVNDTYGHHVGDLLLQEFSQRISYGIRDSDTAARLAGDEFVVVIDGYDSLSQLEMLAERLLRSVAEHYTLDGHRLSISASIGVSSFPDDGRDPSVLLKSADRAMYSAKEAGRNQVYFFNHQMQAEIERHLRLHEEILLGIHRGEFEVYYQPIMALDSLHVGKCEALVRWNHSERGMVSPVEFIPVAEQMGSIRELGEFVLQQVCQDINLFKKQGLQLTVAVNRSVTEFHTANADKRWLDTLKRAGVSGEEIVFEITESLLMEKNTKQLTVINNLRRQRAQFAIDDFGTGYSALNYLRSYPVEYLKIDRSFIQDILDDEQDRTLVDVIIRMGNTLGIQVIAEGVESAAQLHMLRELQCGYIQGFLLSKPLPRNEFIEQCLSNCWVKNCAMDEAGSLQS